MKYKLLISALFFYAFYANAQESFMTKTETKYWDAANAYNGYTLFGTRGTTYLIDMEGKVVHTWNIGTNPRFTEGGTLLDAAGGDPSHSNTWKELDWNGNIVWQYTESRSGYWPHHDFVKIFNPKLGDSTFLYIANKDLTSQQCLDAGCSTSNTYTNPQMDAIVEVDMQGNIIWEWCFFNHVVQDLYSSKPTYGVVQNNPGKIDLNIPGNPVQKDWNHCNSLDYNQDKDLIVINSVHGEFYVIDHGNTFIPNDADSSITLAASTAGDFLYRFGDPAKYDQGLPPSVSTNWEKASSGHKQIGGAHNIQWIKPGLPGAGNFLVFNNAENLFELTPQSYIVEINPYLNSAGTTTSSFVNPPLAGYNIVNSPNSNLMKEKKNVSKQIVWTYSSKNNTSFYSTIGSGAQRLSNGNTLVCSMNDGHFFEVKPSDTSIVWEYINPMTRDGIKKVKMDNYPTYNGVFRAYRYTSDHPALTGHDLTSGNTITGDTPDYFVPADLLTKVNDNKNYIKPEDLINKNYPNPFNSTTTIEFDVDDSKQLSISILDNSGNFVKELADKTFTKGKQTIEWDGTNENGTKVSSGTYFYVIKTDNQQVSKKLILIK